MQLLKALLLVGTLAGLAMASNSNGGYSHSKGGYHHKGGVIKRTILIDGCTGKPISHHPYPHQDEVDPGFDGTRPPIDPGFDGTRPHFDDETIFEDDYPQDDFDFFNGEFNGFDDGTYGDDGDNLVYRDEPTFGPL